MKKTESYFNLKPQKIIYLKAMCTFSNMVKSVPLMILQRAAAEKFLQLPVVTDMASADLDFTGVLMQQEGFVW